MRAAIALAMLAASLTPLTAAAQSAVAVEGSPADATNKGAPGRTDNTLNGVDFSLDISEDDSAASIQYGWTTVDKVTGADQFSTSGLIKASIPLGGADDLTSKGTLDALGNGPKLTARFSFLTFGSASARLHSPGFQPIMDTARKACREAAPVVGDVKDCDLRFEDAGFARRWAGDATVNEFLFRLAVRGGIEGSVGINRFANIEPVTLIERKPIKPQFAVSGFVTLYPSDRSTAITARAEYQNAFKADDEKILCKPAVVVPADDCKKGVPTRPHNVELINLSLAVTKAFPINDRFSFGIGPKATVDMLSGKWGVEMPFYLITPAKWPIAPAVVVSYSSEDDAFDAALVLRKTFSF